MTQGDQSVHSYAVHSTEFPASSCEVALCCTYANVVVFTVVQISFSYCFYPFSYREHKEQRLKL